MKYYYIGLVIVLLVVFAPAAIAYLFRTSNNGTNGTGPGA